MSMFSTAKSAASSVPPRDRTAEDPQPRLAVQVEADASLPRHLLVSLAGITADVTTLQQRCVATPQLHASLSAILCRLDGLVNSIYEGAADPTAPDMHRPGPSSALPSDARVCVPVELPDAKGDAPARSRTAEG